MRTANLFFTAGLLASGLLLSSCSSSPKADAPKTDAPKTAEKAAPKEYPMKGEIMGLDAEVHVATVKHEAIEGFMSAMTMGYPVKDTAEFAKLAAGDNITATVYVDGDDMYIGNIRKAAKDAAPPAKK